MKRTALTGMFLSMIILHGCSVFEQATQVKNFATCEFRLESANQVKLGGVNIQGKNGISDLGVMDYAKIAGAAASGSLPLTFNLNVGSKNPNPGTAAMNKMEWILFIDDIEMTRGILNERIEIPAQGTSVFPLAMQIDLMEALSGKSGDALLNFGFNLSGSGSRPTRITLKARPTVYVGNTLLQYPGYITVNHEYGGK